MIKVLFSKRSRTVLFIVLLVIISLNVIENPIRGTVWNIFASSQSALWKIGDSFSDAGKEVFDAGRLKTENERLLLENAELEQKIGELESIQKENEKLREALAFGLEEDYTFVEGEILFKDPTQDVLVIRSGTGVKEGMPVITSEKIAVGRIEEVIGEFSRVRLLSHTQSSVDVVVGEDRIGGVLKGRGKFQAIIELLPQDAVIQQGDIVSTYELGGIFPRNFLVGKVTEAITSDVEPFQRAVLEPSFNISLYNVLLVITNYDVPSSIF